MFHTDAFLKKIYIHTFSPRLVESWDVKGLYPQLTAELLTIWANERSMQKASYQVAPTLPGTDL